MKVTIDYPKPMTFEAPNEFKRRSQKTRFLHKLLENETGGALKYHHREMVIKNKDGSEEWSIGS